MGSNIRINGYEAGGNTKNVRHTYILILLISVLWAFVPQVMGAGPASWPDCSFGCTANDVNVLDVYLGDSSGNELGPCNPGDSVTAYICAIFENNANSARYAVTLLANISIDSVLEESFWNYTPHDGLCVLDSIGGKTNKTEKIYSFTWTCGQEVKLENVVISWVTSSTNCSDYESNSDLSCAARGTSKCYKEAGILVRGPLIVNFNFTNVCFCTNTTFTDTTTGGNRSVPYTYHWDFGEGNTSSEKNPSYHYTSAGNYTVNLTVTDVDGRSDSKTREVTVYPNPTANIAPDPAETCTGVNLQLNGTPSGGTPPYTHSWTEDGATYLSATNIANPVFNSSIAGTYNLTYNLTDSSGCTETDDIQVAVYNSSLSINKTANTTEPVGPGDVIEYNITVCNIGNVTINNVTVTDNRTGPHDIGTLAKSECDSVKSNYTVTEEDVCNGSVGNSAYATGDDKCGKEVRTGKDATLSIPTTYNSSLSINKTANTTGPVGPGDVIEYNITVKNTGTVNLTEVEIIDDLADLNESILVLKPGESQSFYPTFTVNETDICQAIVNNATIEAKDACGKVISKSASVIINTTYNASISITKDANTSGPIEPGDVIEYNVTVKNTGTVNLTEVEIIDDLADLNESILVLKPGESQSFNPTFTVNETDICQAIVNNATAVAKDPCGNEVDPPAAGIVTINTTYNASIEITILANVTEVGVGDVIGYTINLTNNGDVTLYNVTVNETLTGNSWDITTLSLNETVFFYTNYTVKESDIGNLINNTAIANSTDPCTFAKSTMEDSTSVVIRSVTELTIKKTALKKEVKRGGDITYIIEVCNEDDQSVHNVKVRDVFSANYDKIDQVSAIPKPEEGNDWIPEATWTFDELAAKDCITITLVVKVKEPQDFEFDMMQGVEGEGFVNVANDYTTTFQPFVIKNCAYAFSDETLTVSDCEHVIVVAYLGTELSTREHGSGMYDSDEIVKVRTENKSIEMDKDVSATHKPTTMTLYNNRTVTYSSRWTEDACAKNRVTGTSMHESYRYATSIDRNSHMKLDKNESEMEVESEFDGMGHIGFIKLSDPATCSCPFLESTEDYTGSFRIYEKVNEYGSSVVSNKSTSGKGLVVVDKHVGDKGCKDSQRSYESGTGSYDSDEFIQTYTNYIAKDISLVHEPISQNLTDETEIGSDLKWKEGMNSKNRKTSFIGEEYSSIESLDKETVARGLNAMETEAEFSGKASYRAVLQPDYENRSKSSPPEPVIDLDEEYVGDYSIERRIHLAGVPKYDHAHMEVAKTGKIFYQTKGTFAEYTITIENDGNQELAEEISVRDILPPGAVYVNSSKGPESLTSDYVLWKLTHLNVGDTKTITLWLNVTEFRGDALINCVEATTEYDNKTLLAKNVSVIEINWLRCCPTDPVFAVKTGIVDPETPNHVLYRIGIENKIGKKMKAKVIDYLPDDMTYLGYSIPASSYENDVVTWNVIDLDPFEAKTINYTAEVSSSGRYMNRALVEAYLEDGSILRPRYVNSVVDVGEFEGEVPGPGWQPPDWGFEQMASSTDLTCEEI